MKLVLIYLVTVCCFVNLGVARVLDSIDYDIFEPEETTKNPDIPRMEEELNGLFETAMLKIRNNINAKTNTADIVRDLIETNATGLLHGYPASCPPVSSAHGIYTVNVTGLKPFSVFCDTSIAGAGWTVIQRRIHGNINFYRNWTQYKHGFGKIDDEFFIGMDKLHAITATTQHELYILLEDFEGNKRHARYDDFAVLNEAAAYKLSSLGKYSGDAGDSLEHHLGQKFSTYDRDNDVISDVCAEKHQGAWWYKGDYCAYSSLNGLYLDGNLSTGHSEKGIYWHHWKGSKYSYKFVQMMIRPKCPNSYEN